ncbi:ADP-ribosylation factor-like protein 13A [Erpetoichthys calabaricus]|uniref:ADP-ribosylation factor-like protein 13A n=1 Tax=Erpetoichthys calabaricus TaxID=27687 RepID=UPI002234D4FB|nr:ADP-ribosylation factor-like protein 13A [Erpetoichthys calabaricus]
MFTLISNCCSWMKKLHEPVRKVTVIVVGLDNAGKTETVKGILKAPPDDGLPTSNFVKQQLRVGQFDVSLIDLDGKSEARGLWKNHYGEAHGFIFILDASDIDRIGEAKNQLASMLKHSRVSGKPLLLLANKQDKANAMLGNELIEVLSLERLVNESHSRCHIEPCSAKLDFQRWSERRTLRGLCWLLHAISLDYSDLCARVAGDSSKPECQVEKENQRNKTVRGSKSRKEKGNEVKVSKKHAVQQMQPSSVLKEAPKSVYDIITKEHKLKRKLKKKKVKISDLSKSKGQLVENIRQTGNLEDESNGVIQNESSLKSGKVTCRSSVPLAVNKVGEVLNQDSKKTDLQERAENSSPKKGKRGKSKKVAKKKNQINSEEAPPSYTQPVDMSDTFDLYRKAILALKARQEQKH